MDVFRDGFAPASDSGKPDEGEIERARAWIKRYGRKLKNYNYNYKSYTLKHCVERWWVAAHPGTPYYVSNGAFILAAEALGYRARPVGDLGDAVFNMSVPSKRDEERRQEAGFIDLPAPRIYF